MQLRRCASRQRSRRWTVLLVLRWRALLWGLCHRWRHATLRLRRHQRRVRESIALLRADLCRRSSPVVWPRMHHAKLSWLLAVASCGGQVGPDHDASLADGGVAEASEARARRTCSDVGKTPTIESCCGGNYCAGKCFPDYRPPCVCEQGGVVAACASDTAYCCPDLGCASLETCKRFLELRDAASE